MALWQRYHLPANAPAILRLLAEYGPDARLIAGGTDLLIELERGRRRATTLIDISRLPTMDRIAVEGGTLRLGARVTHSQAAATPEVVTRAFPLARACWEVGAPQIRNRGTIVGNLVTASPANDTITPLWALDARLRLASVRGARELSFPEFFQGVRQTALAADEMVTEVVIPLLPPTARGVFIKLGLRRAQAISLVNVAAIVEVDGRTIDGAPRAARARLALGAVAPTILRALEAEEILRGAPPSDAVIEAAAEAAARAAQPIDDVRASAEYRRQMVRVLTRRALRQLRAGKERRGWPEAPVTLGGARPAHPWSDELRWGGEDDPPIVMTVNGQRRQVRGAQRKTLLHLLRDDLHLTGAKEGCAEGECGACTVLLDGAAVMACLVPAPRAHGAEVITVEGLSRSDGASERWHPVQQAFIDAGAVQCGYCTPGLLLSAASLLQERPRPTVEEIQWALTGNLCRCTGYYKIIEAVERAAASRPRDTALAESTTLDQRG